MPLVTMVGTADIASAATAISNAKLVLQGVHHLYGAVAANASPSSTRTQPVSAELFISDDSYTWGIRLDEGMIARTLGPNTVLSWTGVLPIPPGINVVLDASVHNFTGSTQKIRLQALVD